MRAKAFCGTLFAAGKGRTNEGMGQSGAARMRQACRALEAVGTGARDATIRRAHGAMSAQLRRVTLLALLCAMAAATHALEGMFAPLIPALPGARLGLANVFTLVALLYFGAADALVLAVLRCLLGTLLSGSVTGLLYGGAGALCAWCAMVLAKRLRLHLILVSVLGAVAHNCAQVACGMWVLASPSLLYMLPWMVLCAIPTGALVALLARGCMRLMERGTGRG